MSALEPILCNIKALLNPNTHKQSKTFPILGAYVSVLLSVDYDLHKVKCSNFEGFISAFYCVDFCSPGELVSSPLSQASPLVVL